MQLYHLSMNPNLRVLVPKVPNNFLVRNGYEDGRRKRISFATTIAGCLRGLSMNVTGKVFYVYSPESLDQSAIIIPDLTMVPDARTTGEVWYMKPCRVKLIGIIEAGKMVYPRKYKYGEHTATNYTARFKKL